MLKINLLIPKIVLLLSIWLPSFEDETKKTLTLIWIVKYVLDADIMRPGHGGIIYKVFGGMKFETSELMVSLIPFVPAIIFEYIALSEQFWIPAIPGALAIVINLSEILSDIKHVIQMKKRRLD